MSLVTPTHPTAGDTIRIYFSTAAGTGARTGPSTDFEADDFLIYKNGSTAQKTTTNGITVTTNFDSGTGLHVLEIDTSNSTGDSGFWADGSDYAVACYPDETVDSVSVAEWIGVFSLKPVPANVTQISGDSTAADNAESFFDGTGYAGTNNVIPTVTTLTNLPAITAGWLTASGIASGALNGKGDWLLSIGYTAPDNASIAAILEDTGTTIPATLATLSTVTNASVRTQVDNAMVAIGLDHLISVAVVGADVADNSIVAKLVSKSATADWDSFANTTDSLEAIRDRGDAAWTTGAGGGGTVTGANTLTITVTDADTSDPIENARVRIYRTGEDGTDTTDASGEVVIGRDSATWEVTVAATGYETLATTLVVSGDDAVSYELTSIVVTPQDAPLCAVTIPIRDQYGNELADEPVEIAFVEYTASATTTPPVLSIPPVQTSDANGNVIVNLYRYGVYKIAYGNHDYARRIQITVPNASTYTVEL